MKKKTSTPLKSGHRRLEYMSREAYKNNTPDPKRLPPQEDPNRHKPKRGFPK